MSFFGLQPYHWLFIALRIKPRLLSLASKACHEWSLPYCLASSTGPPASHCMSCNPMPTAAFSIMFPCLCLCLGCSLWLECPSHFPFFCLKLTHAWSLISGITSFRMPPWIPRLAQCPIRILIAFCPTSSFYNKSVYLYICILLLDCTFEGKRGVSFFFFSFLIHQRLIPGLANHRLLSMFVKLNWWEEYLDGRLQQAARTTPVSLGTRHQNSKFLLWAGVGQSPCF